MSKKEPEFVSESVDGLVAYYDENTDSLQAYLNGENLNISIVQDANGETIFGSSIEDEIYVNIDERAETVFDLLELVVYRVLEATQ